MATTALLTADDLLRLPDDDHRYALIRGRLIRMPPPGFRHGRVGSTVVRHLGNHVEAHGLGVVVMECGFLLARDPDVVLGPDVAFVRAERLPPEEAQVGYLPLAPDLAVEVVSPSNRPKLIAAKVAEYEAAGVPLVWIADPDPRTVTVRAAGQPPRVLHEGDILDGGEVLPGLRLPVADIFR